MPYPRRPDKPCEWCSAPFHGPSRKQRFCSNQCFADARFMDCKTRFEKRCSRCEETKPLDAFARASKRTDGRQSVCKACGLELRRTTQRGSELKRKWNMTVAEFDAMLADQGNACAICERPHDSTPYLWHVDHDHASGRIRAILCSPCNTGLGHFKDDPNRLILAAMYLIRNQEKEKVA